MSNDKKILNELRDLKALCAMVQDKAAILISKMEGEKGTISPRAITRRAIVIKAVARRNKNLKVS